MTVAANCKQVLTIAIAVFLFNLKINFTNGIGIVLTLIGGVSLVTVYVSQSDAELTDHVVGCCVGMVRLDRIPRRTKETAWTDRQGALDDQLALDADFSGLGS